jgi:putative transcriptional regulator
MTKLGQDLLQSAEEALAIASGAAVAPRAVVPQVIDVAGIRKRLRMSQVEFASRYGLNAAMVRDWEQKRRNPDQAARTLLTIISREPEAVERALAAA